MTPRVALLGLSGVGKSTLVSQLKNQRPVLHLQASALIKAEQTHRAERPATSEALRLGAVLENQHLMIAAFLRIAADSDLPIVFDGHSIIDGRDGIVEIPSDVFASLNLTTICFMEAEPAIIAQRRLDDTGRDRPFRSLQTLAEHQRAARNAAERIAAEINCPFLAIRDDPDPVIQLFD